MGGERGGRQKHTSQSRDAGQGSSGDARPLPGYARQAKAPPPVEWRGRFVLMNSLKIRRFNFTHSIPMASVIGETPNALSLLLTTVAKKPRDRRP